MNSVVALNFRGTVSNRGFATALLEAPGDAVLVERGRPRLLVLACPCGCGEAFPINLDPRAGPAWRMYRGKRFGRSFTAPAPEHAQLPLSVFPSVWREDGCRSHYVIWDDRILLFGSCERDFEIDEGLNLPSAEEVFAQLPIAGLREFAEVAEALGAVPWDVLKVCRELVRDGRAREGAGKQGGSFGRLTMRR